VADVRVIARNTGPASAAFTVAHQLPAGVTTSEPLSRILTIAAGEDERFMLPLRLPTTAGNFTLTGTLSAGSQLLDTDTLTLTGAAHAGPGARRRAGCPGGAEPDGRSGQPPRPGH
jgi:hypothetical protein